MPAEREGLVRPHLALPLLCNCMVLSQAFQA